jgi:hypothetical protein
LKLVFTLFYFVIAINYLCEVGCDPSCDPSLAESIIAIEECEHPSCELSHEDQHNYVKDDVSDSSQKKFLKSIKVPFQNNNYEIICLEESHLKESNQIILTHSETHFLPNRKRFLIFHRFKLFVS